MSVTIEKRILEFLPYQRPFLFVDGFERIDEDGAEGHYRFREDEFFYPGHFPDRPVTPGVILIETMAQIGLVGLGIFLTQSHITPRPRTFAFTESNVSFLRPVFPGQQIRVRSEKVYFRLSKLKCQVEMIDEAGEQITRGTLSGVLLPDSSS